MSVITDILGAPAKGLLDGVGDIIGKFVKDPTEALKAQEQAMALQNSFQIAIIQADKEVAEAQAQVIENEEKEGWLPANWRPIIMLSFGLIIIYTYFVGPMFGLKTVDIPQQLWTIMTAGITGYVGLRSFEKIANSDGISNIASIITGKPLPANLNDIANASKVGVKVE